MQVVKNYHVKKDRLTGIKPVERSGTHQFLEVLS